LIKLVLQKNKDFIKSAIKCSRRFRIKNILVGLLALGSLSAFAEGSLERCVRHQEKGTKAATLYNAWPDGRPALNELAGFKTVVGLNSEATVALTQIKHGSRVEVIGVEDDQVVFAKSVIVLGSCK
jgi:hypothetical protein